MKKGEKRKQELLEIAYRMFLSKGYEETSIDEIIEQAGIAKGTYYYYFESKEQTLEEVIGMILDREEENARKVLGSDMSVPEKIVHVIASFRPEAREVSIRDTLNKPENIIMHEKMNRRLTERIVPVLSEVAEQGIREGIFACESIPERMRMIVILASALFDEGYQTEEDVSVFIDTVERMLYAQPGSMGFIRQLISGGQSHDK